MHLVAILKVSEVGKRKAVRDHLIGMLNTIKYHFWSTLFPSPALAAEFGFAFPLWS